MADTEKTLEWLQNQISQATPSGSKQRRYKPKKITPNNEEAYVSPMQPMWDDVYGATPDPLKPVVGGAAAFSSGVNQLQANVLSGVMQIPGDVAGMADLIRVGAPALVTSIPDRGDGSDYFKRLGDDFSNGVFSPDAKQAVTDHIKTKAKEFAAVKPDATPEQLAAFVDGYQDSQEFFDYMTNQMSPGFKLAQFSNDWANKLAGLDKRPDQQSIVDDLEQVFGQSVVGLPKSVMKELGKTARKAVGDGIMDSVLGQTAAKAAELVTPMTLPLTPGNVALNTGVGAAITEGVRDLTGSPSFLNGQVPEFKTTDLDPPDAHGINLDGQIDNTLVGAGVALGSFFAFPAFRRNATQEAADAAIKGLRAGRTLGEQTDKLDPLLSPITGLADSNAPIVKGANIFGADDEVLDHLDAQQSGASRTNRVEAEVNAINHGILPNMDNTVPLVDIQRYARELKPDQYELLNQYAYAVQRVQDATAQTKTLKQSINDAGYSYQAAAARGDTKAATKANENYQNLRTQLAQLEADNPNSRTLMEDWSMKDVRDIIARAEASPEIVQVRKAMEKVGNDITTLLVKNGRISAEEGTKRMGTRPWYLKVAERNRPDVDNKLARSALLLKDRIFKPNNVEGSYLRDRPTGRTEGDVIVNRPKDALVALQEGMMEAVRDVTANNARREIVETLERLPGAKGKMFRPFQFDFGGNKTEWVNDGQYNAEGRKQLGSDRAKYVSYYKDGKRRFVEFSDQSMAKALQFAPLVSVPIANATRKVWQSFTTGLAAPWFAAKSAMWDVPVAKTTSRQGRSLGLIDTYARRVFNESHGVNAIMDQVTDPTAWVSAISAIPYQMSMRSARAVGSKIAQDLQHGSGLFNMMAQVPGGEQFLNFVGTSMSKAFDRSVYNVYSKNLSTNIGHLVDATTIKNDYNVRGKGTTLGNGFRSTINAYKAAVESIQNSTRMAFFVENYGRLEAKHKGSIPKGELEKLVQETRALTGDMSRTSNSKFIQGLTTVIPYSNPTIQGTRHMLSSAIPPSVARGINKLSGGKANMTTNRTNKFWGQFISGMMLPSLGAMAVVDSWQGAQDWWYNKVPEWERGTVIPMPTYEALEYRWEHGEWPEFDPKYMHKIPIAPEFMMFREPALAGLRALGVFGPATTHIKQDFGSQMASTFEQATNFATPPVAQALAAFSGGKLDLRSFLLSPFGMGGGDAFQETQNSTFGGVNADKMTTNSGIDKNVYNAIGAIFSSSGQLVAQTFNVADIAMKEGDDFGTALNKATETFGYEVARKFPNVPGLPGMERNYAFTPESEYVYDTERVLDPLIGNGRQRTIELDSKDRIPRLKEMGLVPPELIQEPLLKQMVEDIYGTLRKKGPFKAADEQYTELRVDLNGLEASRGKWPEEAYHEKYNEIVSDQQKLKGIQAHLLTNLEQELVGKYGRVFQSVTGNPLTYKSLVEAVKANVSQ